MRRRAGNACERGRAHAGSRQERLVDHLPNAVDILDHHVTRLHGAGVALALFLVFLRDLARGRRAGNDFVVAETPVLIHRAVILRRVGVDGDVYARALLRQRRAHGLLIFRRARREAASSGKTFVFAGLRLASKRRLLCHLRLLHQDRRLPPNLRITRLRGLLSNPHQALCFGQVTRSRLGGGGGCARSSGLHATHPRLHVLHVVRIAATVVAAQCNCLVRRVIEVSRPQRLALALEITHGKVDICRRVCPLGGVHRRDTIAGVACGRILNLPEANRLAPIANRAGVAAAFLLDERHRQVERNAVTLRHRGNQSHQVRRSKGGHCCSTLLRHYRRRWRLWRCCLRCPAHHRAEICHFLIRLGRVVRHSLIRLARFVAADQRLRQPVDALPWRLDRATVGALF